MKLYKIVPVLLIVIACIFGVQANATLSVDQKLINPEKEMQAKELFKEVYCVVCSGQSLADSHVPLAMDMKKMIRQQINEGQADEEILNQLVSVYGDKILMKPPFNYMTYILWFMPLILVVLAILSLGCYFKSIKHK